MDGKATIALPAWAPAAAGAHSRGVDRLLMRPASDVAVRVRRGHVRAGVDPIVLSARRSCADTELLIASRQLFGLWLRKEIYAIDRNQNRRSPHLTMVWTLKKPKLCGPKDSIPTLCAMVTLARHLGHRTARRESAHVSRALQGCRNSRLGETFLPISTAVTLINPSIAHQRLYSSEHISRLALQNAKTTRTTRQAGNR
jgi:hypothetical protein